MRIAVIFESSPFDRKGLFNAVHNRILHLKEVAENDVIEAYCLQSDDSFLARQFRKSPKQVSKPGVVEIDGLRYNMIWYKADFFDYVRTRFSGCPEYRSHLAEIVSRLRSADLVIAHSYAGGVAAHEAMKSFGIPYFVNWHGSDVHTRPWKNPGLMSATRSVMSAAAVNCFVSRALMEKGLEICPSMNAEVLYNGVSPMFERYDDTRRTAVREKFGVPAEARVLAYAGNFYAVKNTAALPDIFFSAGLKYHEETGREPLFWVIGDGHGRSDVEAAMSVPCKFWGNQPAELMPDFMNCVDVLVLPSRNEGLPLVAVEALKCGANVVGSRVGGIPEAVGDEFTVPFVERHTPGYGEFVSGMGEKIAALLLNPAVQSLPPFIDWHSTAILENSLIRSVADSE